MAEDRCRVVIGIDPGSDKCGLAVVRLDGEIVYRSIVARQSLAAAVQEALSGHDVEALVVGDRTGSGPVVKLAREIAGEARVKLVDEHNSTLRARDLYWELNPPSLLARLIPQGLRVPPGPIDDYAAAVLARRYLAEQKSAAP